MEASLMTAFRNIGTAALLVIFGAAIPAFAQDRPEESKPAQHEEQAKPAQQEEAKPAQHEEAAKPAKPEEQPKTAKQEAAKPEKQAAAKPVQHAQAKPAQHTAKPAAQEDKATAEKQPAAKTPQPTRAAKQTPAAAKSQESSKQVTQQRTSTAQQQSHGSAPQRTQEAQQRQHAEPALRLSSRGSGRIPDARFQANFGHEHVFVIGSPQIEGGYSRFQYGGYYFGFVQPWPAEWYYTDNVYVDYIDGGYYLYNPYYPGARVMISVVI
jgi:glucan-binding YG repeat protein